MLDEAGTGTLAVGGDGAGHLGDRAAVAGERLEQLDHARLALALEHAVDRALAVLQDGRRGEGGAVAADADEGARQESFVAFARSTISGTLAR